jgi:hypothetical protein
MQTAQERSPQSVKAWNTRLHTTGRDFYDVTFFQVSAAALRTIYEDVAPGS